MKLLSREQIETLAKFKSNSLWTTSFYLDTSKNRLTKKEIQLSLKNLINSNKTRLEKMSLSKENKESLVQDLESIQKFCAKNLNAYSYVGLALFSCSKKNFWQEFNLVNSPKNTIVFDQNPYVRPLSAFLGEYNRICAFIIDRKEAKWYDIYMGEISLLESLKGDVPSKVREGGWEGYESKRIERHIASLLHNYFSEAAKSTFDLSNKNKFDWLFLGCSDEYASELEPLLHPYTKKRLKGRIKAKPSDSPTRVLKEVLELKQKLNKEEKEDIVRRFIAEIEKGGLAVSGLKNTLRKLNRGEAQTLLVTRHFSKPGRICPKCYLLYEDELRCTSCQRKTEKVVDVIDEAVEAAWEKGSQVKHINPPSDLRKYGNIGVLLRYKA
jgi:peptide subunit release factor 1 (eRF1)